MNKPTIIQFLIAAGVGIITTAGFDAIFHGLSHSGHGFLDRFWEGEVTQRTTKPAWFGSIAWHLTADILIAVFLASVLFLYPDKSFLFSLGFGVLMGCLVATQWIHVYAAFQISNQIVIVLGFLAIIQITLASLIIGWIYQNT